MKNIACQTALLIAGLTFCVSFAGAQIIVPRAEPPPFTWPPEIKNRQALPPAVGGDQLRDIMRSFSQALGVRCTYCHTGTEEIPLSLRDFASDANPRKETARAMIRLVRHLNQDHLTTIPGLRSPAVTCYTCHRGDAKPAMAPPSLEPEPSTR